MTIRKTLAQWFGTPDAPRAPPGSDLDGHRLGVAAGPVGGDAQGVQRGLFRRHCVACHGLAGEGAGPTAAVLDPYPRDFRNGVFKYTSTRSGAKPTIEDLRRTLLRGIAGTAMPSFAYLANEETDALLEYIQYLSIRGETELALIASLLDDGVSTDDLNALQTDSLEPALESWRLPLLQEAELVVVPPPRLPRDRPKLLAEATARGRQRFLEKNCQCATCHGPRGDGRGEQSNLADDWNKRKQGATPEETAQLASRFTLPFQPLRPRDFRQGVFHGGSRPEDLYCRVCVGIKGTPMPAAGAAPGATGVLSPQEIRDVVEFVRSLSKDAKKE